MADLEARSPTLEIIKLEQDTIKFSLSSIDISLANALRRVMISQVPTLAIDNVHVHTNTSSLHDEFIVHRLGLIPLVSQTMDNYEFSRNCSCNGHCEFCTIQFRLRVKNTETSILDVTSRDLRNIGQHGGEVRPADFDAPIILLKLKRNQELDVTCFARKGTHREHAKWSPVATATYKQSANIFLKHEKIRSISVKERQEFVQSCPVGVYKLLDVGDIEVAKPQKCMFCDECVRKGEMIITQSPTTFLSSADNLVRIEENQDKFFFQVESTGALKPEHIVMKGLQILCSKLDLITEYIPKLRT